MSDTLLKYPYVVVRIGCRFCDRKGSYRLARLAVKFGTDAKLDDVARRLASDCPHWKRNMRWPEGCGVYLPDLQPPQKPPDRPIPVRLRLVR